MMRRYLAVAVLLVAVLAGCEEDVTAVLGTERAFTLYGVINPRTDTQWVRVFPIDGTLLPTRPEPLDAVFTSTDSATGETRVWRDSLFQQPDGSYGHLFWAPFRAEYGHTYALAVAGADDRTSRVTVDVPEHAELELGAPLTAGGVLLPAFLHGDLPRLIKAEALFSVIFVTGYTPAGAPILEHLDYAVGYDDRVRRIGTGWRFDVDLSRAYSIIRDEVTKRDDYKAQHGITLSLVTFRTIVASNDWDPPNGSFDPNVLIQPDAMTNVEGGFGFVGAGYRLQHRWVPLDDVVERTGFMPCCSAF